MEQAGSVVTGAAVLKCSCGRILRSVEALEQHQRDSNHHAATTSPSANASLNQNSNVPSPLKGVKRPKNTSSNAWMFKNTTERVHKIHMASIEPTSVAVTSANDRQLLCTYNWLNHKHPTVHVPGGAPRFVQPNLPIVVPPDSGLQYIDQNTSRLPKYPFEVVFQAMEVMSPGTKFDDIDVLINRNSLRKLLDLCHGRNRESFRINLFVISNTLVVERCEKNLRPFLSAHGQTGYGHNFERAITDPEPGSQQSTCHHRVLSYKIGEVKCAVRFEVDARYSSPETSAASLAESLSMLHVQNSASDIDPQPSQSESIKVIRRGALTPQSQVAEIKGRGKSLSMSQVIPQLWFGRTPWLIKGSHNEGTFHTVTVNDIGQQFSTWESQDANQRALRKLSSILKQLRDGVRNMNSRTAVVVFDSKAKPAELQIFGTSSDRKPLPESIIAKFWTGANR